MSKKTPLPPRTAKSIRTDNLNNRIAGTTDLIEKALTNIQDLDSQIRTRVKRRKQLIGCVRERSDYSDFVSKDRKAFDQEISEAKAGVAEIRKNVARWTAEVGVLKMKLRYAEG